MKTTRRPILLMLFLLVLVSACQPLAPAKFQPKEGSAFKLTFSYPANWVWEVNPNSNKTFSSMTVLEPYPASKSVSITSSRLVGLMVDVNTLPQISMQERIDSFLEGIKTLDWIELLNDETLQIDSYFARWVTVKKLPPLSGETQPFICEYVYVLTKDRYYQVFICIPEDELNGQFHNEFKAMIESIKILP
jgi:hypothetical protein